MGGEIVGAVATELAGASGDRGEGVDAPTERIHAAVEVAVELVHAAGDHPGVVDVLAAVRAFSHVGHRPEVADAVGDRATVIDPGGHLAAEDSSSRGVETVASTRALGAPEVSNRIHAVHGRSASTTAHESTAVDGPLAVEARCIGEPSSLR